MNEASFTEHLLMTDPSKFIHDLLIDRKSANSSYSARALARDLGLSPGFMSQVMSKKKNMSLEQKMRLASKLGISFTSGAAPSKFSQKYETLQHTIEHEKLLKHWYHIAIIELTKTKDPSSNPSRVAKKLGISEVEARTAINRLVHFGYLTINKNKLIRSKTPFIIDSKKSSQALRDYHQSRLLGAHEELKHFEQSRIEYRDFRTLFVPSSKTKIKKAKELITDFQKKLVEFLMEEETEEVFQVSLQMFSVEQPSISKKRSPL